MPQECLIRWQHVPLLCIEQEDEPQYDGQKRAVDLVRALLEGIAEQLAASLGRVAVVTAGVHDDDIDAEGIATYLRLGEELAEKLVRTLG